MIEGQYGVVYLLRNTLNGKCYVGQTTGSVERRFGQHASTSKDAPITRALKKYGRESFTKEALYIAFGKDSLDAAEILLITDYNSQRPEGYNVQAGGSYGSPETRKKLSAALRGKIVSPETRAKFSAVNLGRKLSQETKEKVSQKLRGRAVSQQTRDKIAASLRGRKRPTEVVEKVANQLRGRKLSPERCLAISAFQRGSKRSPEARESIRLGWIKRKAAAEHHCGAAP